MQQIQKTVIKKEGKYLKKFLNEHFVYEANALYFAMVKLHDQDKIENKNQDEINMALESFLFHGRNLIEFFYYKNDAENYSRAFHFIEKDEWLKIRPKKTKQISEVQDRSNKEIVHLTYDRIAGSPPEKNWNCSNTFGDFLEIIKIFLNQLPKKYYEDKIINLKNNINEVKNIK